MLIKDFELYRKLEKGGRTKLRNKLLNVGNVSIHEIFDQSLSLIVARG